MGGGGGVGEGAVRGGVWLACVCVVLSRCRSVEVS